MNRPFCCFIEHRKIEDRERVAEKVKEVVQMLIEEKGVRTFHFGSRSKFDDLCHLFGSDGNANAISRYNENQL